MINKRRGKADLQAPEPNKDFGEVAPSADTSHGSAIPRVSRKPRKPVPQDIQLTARQFCRARKYRWERCAGFLHDMKKEHPHLATRAEWGELWDAFWSRPVK